MENTSRIFIFNYNFSIIFYSLIRKIPPSLWLNDGTNIPLMLSDKILYTQLNAGMCALLTTVRKLFQIPLRKH